MSNKLVEKIGSELYCVNCGINYNKQRKHAGTIDCVNVNTCHVYKNINLCPVCGEKAVKGADRYGSPYYICLYCHNIQYIKELQDE